MRDTYTRSYGSAEDALRLPPESYDGTAFAAAERCGGAQEPEAEDTAPCNSRPARGGRGGLRIPFLENLLSADGSVLRGVSTEELLIIGLSLFLLLSKNGDTECAVMLLLLLFIRD